MRLSIPRIQGQCKHIAALLGRFELILLKLTGLDEYEYEGQSHVLEPYQ